MIRVASLILFAFTAPAYAAQSNLRDALAYEWFMAHCDLSKADALVVMTFSMVINGSDPKVVERERPSVRAYLEGQGTVEKVCQNFYKRAEADKTN